MRLIIKLILPVLVSSLALPAAAQTLEKIQKSKTFVIAHRESSVPLSYLDADKKPIGLAVGLCERIAEAIKRELRLTELKTQYLLVTSSTRIDAIKDGRADIECGSTTDTYERREQVTFSHHHYFAAVQFLAKVSSGIKDWNDLNKKTVVFTKGTSTADLLKRNPTTATVPIDLIEGRDHAESFSMVESGKADVFAMEDVLLAGLRANAKDPAQYVVGGARLTIEPYGLMLRKGDTAFLRVVNNELSRLYKTGEYSKLYRKWFQEPIPPKDINLSLPPSMVLRDQITYPSSIIPPKL
jgi:ABC-type amino acid transport substrate-binding protein